jgi:hypothetical protein
VIGEASANSKGRSADRQAAANRCRAWQIGPFLDENAVCRYISRISRGQFEPAGLQPRKTTR